MNNKKGFTLVEILVVIALMLVVAALVIPNLTNSDKAAKDKAYESKIMVAKSAAYKYGNDKIDELTSNCQLVTIGELISDGYLEGDNENKDVMLNPNNNQSMNDEKICVRFLDGEVVTEYEVELNSKFPLN